MKLNIKRGMNRIFAVGAVAWLGFVAYLPVQEHFELTRTRMDGAFIVYRACLDLANKDSTGDWFARHAPPDTRDKAKEKCELELKSGIAEAEATPLYSVTGKDIVELVAFALIPLAVVYGLCAGLIALAGWISAGFVAS